MKNNIILITGGTSGIGYSLMKQLQKNNKVIVCARSYTKLERFRDEFKNVTFIRADISNPADVSKLKDKIEQKYGFLDILINNAGVANYVDLEGRDSLNFDDMDINFKGTLQLTSILIPLIKKSNNAPKIVIISSILSKVPLYEMPIYSASKAALHSYALSLRQTLDNIKVIEILPPLVNTPMTETIDSDAKMEVEKVASIIIRGIEKGKDEVYPGIAKRVNIASKFFFNTISRIVNTQ